MENNDDELIEMLENLQTALAKEQDRVSVLEKNESNLQSKISNLQSELDEKTKLLNKMTVAKEEADNDILNANTEINLLEEQYNAEIAKANETTKKLEEHIKTLENEKQEAEKKANDRQAEITDLNNQIAELKAQAQADKETISLLNKQLAKKIAEKPEAENHALSATSVAAKAKGYFKSKTEIALSAVALILLYSTYDMYSTDRLVTDFKFIPVALYQYCEGLWGSLAILMLGTYVYAFYKILVGEKWLNRLILVCVYCVIAVVTVMLACVVANFTLLNIFVITYILLTFINIIYIMYKK